MDLLKNGENTKNADDTKNHDVERQPSSFRQYENSPKIKHDGLLIKNENGINWPIWIQAASAIFIVIVTAFYTYYARQQVIETRKAVEIANKSFEASEGSMKSTLTEMRAQSEAMKMAAKAANSQATISKNAFEAANSQYQLPNRPFVFISGWGEFQKLKEMQTIRMILENVGKLPACFEKIEYTMVVGNKRFPFEGPDFQKPTFIFPGQKNIHMDLPVLDIFHPDIKANGGFTIECRVNYYSLTDKSKKHKYSYSVRYDLRMKSPESNMIDEHILREIGVE